MPELLTRVEIPPARFSIDYQSKIVFMGSCFAESIGKKMKNLKFQVAYNPFGVLYNPVSISKSINTLLEKEAFTKSDLTFANELWFSYTHYTMFSDVDPDHCLLRINESFRKARDFIRSAGFLALTLGTSWVYRLKETGEVVANCHKMPASVFTRMFSSVDESFVQLKTAIEAIRKINPEIRIIITVSPIRHWKEGAINNQRSKAALLLAISRLQEEMDEVFYFPVYEIFMDELRDYRFYAADMLHPSEYAIDYIWTRFSDTFFKDKTQQIVKKVQNIYSCLQHRPRHTNTKAYKDFIRKLHSNIQELVGKYPFLDYQDELAFLEQ